MKRTTRTTVPTVCALIAVPGPPAATAPADDTCGTPTARKPAPDPRVPSGGTGPVSRTEGR
jgi:hypothetical protein